jgi:hypothetical protein
MKKPDAFEPSKSKSGLAGKTFFSLMSNRSSNEKPKGKNKSRAKPKGKNKPLDNNCYIQGINNQP